MFYKNIQAKFDSRISISEILSDLRGYTQDSRSHNSPPYVSRSYDSRSYISRPFKIRAQLKVVFQNSRIAELIILCRAEFNLPSDIQIKLLGQTILSENCLLLLRINYQAQCFQLCSPCKNLLTKITALYQKHNIYKNQSLQ